MEIITIEVPENLFISIVTLINNEAYRYNMKYVGIEKNALAGGMNCKKLTRRTLFQFSKNLKGIDNEKYLRCEIRKLHLKRGQDII